MNKQFFRSYEYRDQVNPSNPRRLRGSVLTSLKNFLSLKRDNPLAPYGKSDKMFTSGGHFMNAVPGLAHAHLTHSLSIVYRVDDNGVVYLYGVYDHDSLGTGQPPNRNKQRSMATQFKNFKFTE